MAARIVRQHWRHIARLGFAVVLPALLLVTDAYADCIDDAAAFHRVHPALVRAIASVESRLNPAARNVNRNGSDDVGLMQINSAWLPMLARYGISRSSLYNACTNAYVGAWILSQNVARLGLNWNAVGAYNAATPHLRLRYARRVYAELLRVTTTDASPSRVPPATFSQQPRMRAALPSVVSTFSPVEQQAAFFTPSSADLASADSRRPQE